MGRGSGGLSMGMVGMLNLVFGLLRTGLLAVVVVEGLAQEGIGVSECGNALLGRIAVLGLLLVGVWGWGWKHKRVVSGGTGLWSLVWGLEIWVFGRGW